MRRFECDKCGEVVVEDRLLRPFCLTHNEFISAYDEHKEPCRKVDLCGACVYSVQGIRQNILSEQSMRVNNWFEADEK